MESERGSAKKLIELHEAVRNYLDSAETLHAATQQGWQDDEVAPPTLPELPLPLRWYLASQEYHVLLVAGGILDQPAWNWLLMQEAGNAYNEHLSIQEKIKSLVK